MITLEGKPVIDPTWTVHITLDAGFVVNGDKMYSKQHKDLMYADHDFPWEHFKATILWDQHSVFEMDLKEQTSAVKQFEFKDSADTQDHCLGILISGADVNNNFVIDNDIITLGVNVRVAVEGIDLAWYVDFEKCFLNQENQMQHGEHFISQNGQLMLKIQTPIYAWLFKNEQAIVKQFSQKH